MYKPIIGIMGPGDTATELDLKHAHRLGFLVAQQGWITLTGGRPVGVMDAASHGAKSGKGLTIGIIPTQNPNDISSAVDIPIITAMGSARNNINILTSTAVIACGIGPGTVSEIALAIAANKKTATNKPIIILNNHVSSKQFFREIGDKNLVITNEPEEAITTIQQHLANTKDYQHHGKR